MHRSGDLVVPLDEGRKLAAAIPGARMVTLPGNNHYMMWQEESTPETLRRMEEFLSQESTGARSEAASAEG
jgi:pimeloyl-ACP methyl ester carboxylesterase